MEAVKVFEDGLRVDPFNSELKDGLQSATMLHLKSIVEGARRALDCEQKLESTKPLSAPHAALTALQHMKTRRCIGLLLFCFF